MSTDITIRLAEPKKDAKALVEIYRPYIENTAISFEYIVPSVEEFQDRMENTLKSYPYLVAEIEGKVAGYAYASRFGERKAFDWAVETSIYVDQSQRKAGVGRALYLALEELLKKQQVVSVNACIAYAPVEDEHLTNDSITFHTRLGYKEAAHFHAIGYKFNTWYDLMWMEKSIGERTKNTPDFIPFPQL